MRTTMIGCDRPCGNEPKPWPMPPRYASPTILRLVGPHELDTLRAALAAGGVPRDLQAKLEALAAGNLLHRSIEQHSLLFIALLRATQDGDFHGGTPADRERLLRVLAYVRKDDDAIPDHRPDGFVDDHQQVRAVTHDLESLLDEFKSWRLRYQVPRLWLAQRPPSRRLPPAFP